MATTARSNHPSQEASSSIPLHIQESVKQRVVELDRVLRRTEKQDPSKLTAGDRIKAREELVEYSVRVNVSPG
jgi:hypothetical protein